jgi:ABC-type Co2+ transport system permease subunit
MIEAETEGSIAHRPIRVVLAAIILLAIALVLAFLLFAHRGPILYGDGDCIMGRDGSAVCVIP